MENIDWNWMWRDQMLKNRAMNSRECVEYWSDDAAAEKYDMMSRQRAETEARRIEKLPLTPESRVLDIGAGPGNLAIPIARRVAEVVAVEPAEGMQRMLEKNIRESGLESIRTVKKKWEDINLDKDLEGSFDIVIASFSLGMLDIKDALEKMNDASCGRVYVYWFAGIPAWEKSSMELRKEITGQDYEPKPKCDIVYNTLYRMGIYPNVEVEKVTNVQVFGDLEEALEHYRKSIGELSREQEDNARKVLSDKLSLENGKLVMRGQSNYVRIWWEK